MLLLSICVIKLSVKDEEEYSAYGMGRGYNFILSNRWHCQTFDGPYEENTTE